MGRRKLLLVDRLPLVGGNPALDLVNTTGARASVAPRERLRTYTDLVVWAGRAGLLDPESITRLEKLGVARADEAGRVLEQARALREQLYEVFRGVVETGTPSQAAVARLSEWWRLDRSKRKLVSHDGRFELRLTAGVEELDVMLWPLVAAAVELLTCERVNKMKRCGECDWIFLDETKNGSRAWCKNDCGDRVRARRHYARTLRDKQTEQ